MVCLLPFFHIFVLFSGDFTVFNILPMLVLNCYLVFLSKKAVMGIWRKYVLDKFCSDMDYSAVGCEFNVYESTIYIQ